MGTIRDHRELRVFQESFAVAVDVYRGTHDVAALDRWLAQQARRSTAAIPSNIAEAWAKRRYPRSFAASLVVAQGEAGEARFWMQYAAELGLMSRDKAGEVDDRLRRIRAQLMAMSERPERWCPPLRRPAS